MAFATLEDEISRDVVDAEILSYLENGISVAVSSDDLLFGGLGETLSLRHGSSSKS